MYEIKCPKCGEIFQVEKAAYAEIVDQVRNAQFNAEVQSRVAAVQATMEARQAALIAKTEKQYEQEALQKEQEIIRLREQARAAEERKELAVSAAVQKKETEIGRLQLELAQEKTQAEGQIQGLKELHRLEMENKDIEIERLRDFKLKQSTKMIGEDLEQHCLISFNQVRMMAFPNAYFEKDNEVVEGTKGDFIYRENTEDGIPLLSIMFEMKNEADATEKKHSNTDFLDKLDKDRKKKGCEYAVLVTMLEPESELYNNGIVAAYQYEKMYIVRPQFFIPLISLLRNAALSGLQTKRELMMARQQNLDVQQFEKALFEFKDKFGRNYELASAHFSKAIDEIDQTIRHLEKVKDYLTKSENQYRLANDKAQDLSIKKLTKGNPTMQEKFEQAGISAE
ncbi:MAG: DUF2130 domain-containing protein [Clostridia bacterium]|nr:DUF2130 domain-containing protein [Clostridia bacterium]